VSSDPNVPSTALTLRESDAIVLSDDVRMQKLWLATQRREWRSLAVLATDQEVDTMRVAELLARLAWSYRGKPSCVFDLRDLSLRLVEYHQNVVHAQVDAGACVVVALSCTSHNPTAVPIARSVDAVILCVGLGTASMKAAEQTLDEVGRDRVLGAIVVREKRSKRPKRA
jgi:hypothetical protein